MRVELQVDLGNGRAKQPAQGLTRPEGSNSRLDRQHRLARQIALAHHFDHLLRTGQVKDMAALASMTDVSRARISQIVNLLQLAPDIQDRILLLSPRGRDGMMSSQSLRKIALISAWDEQRAALKV